MVCELCLNKAVTLSSSSDCQKGTCSYTMGLHIFFPTYVLLEPLSLLEVPWFRWEVYVITLSLYDIRQMAFILSLDFPHLLNKASQFWSPPKASLS